MRSLLPILGCTVVWLAGCGAPGDSAATPTLVGNADELSAALAGATSGDQLVLAAGSYRGSFLVPPGVSLQGAGTGRTILVGGDRPALALAASGSSRLTGLTIRSASWALVAGLTPAGLAPDRCPDEALNVALESVAVSASRGSGMALACLDELVIEDVTLTGNLPADPAGVDLMTQPEAGRWTQIGLSLDRCAHARADRLQIDHFGRYGALLSRTDLVWTAGGVTGAVWSGILATDGTRLELRQATIRDVLQGNYGYGYGLAVIRGSTAVTSEVQLLNNVVGLLQVGEEPDAQGEPRLLGSSGQHTDLVVRQSRERGVWIQGCRPAAGISDQVTVSLTGSATAIEQSTGVGLGILDSSGILFSGGRVSGTTERLTKVEGEVAFDYVGHGLQVLRSDGLRFADAVFERNARVGVLVGERPAWLDSTAALDVRFDRVRVTAGAGEPPAGRPKPRGFALQDATLADPTALPTIDEALRQEDLHEATTKLPYIVAPEPGPPTGLPGPVMD